MKAKAFIASKQELSKRLIDISCKKYNIETIVLNDEKYFINELETSKPDILFLNESLFNIMDRAIIDEIKDVKGLEHTFIIFSATSNDLSSLTQKIGADEFLPIPFSKMKFESIIRSAVNMPKKILLVSKNESNVEEIKEELLKIGFIVYFAESGDECMRVTHDILPDLIITDYYLFDMKGTLLCEKVKKANLSNHIPVVILFKGNSSDIIEECFEVGARDVLLYPLKSLENYDRITSIITPPVKGRKEKALVIDDSQMVRGLITKMFKQLGFIVTSAENGLEGLKAAKKLRPDIITCDYDMPVMNGWDFCMEVKQDEDINSPIIMVSARGADIDKKKGKVLGVVEYLSKPFKEQDLKEAVAKAIADKKKKKEREAISKYIASDVLENVSDIIEGIKNRDPEEKVITVMFTDICSFTQKCEKLSPIAVVKLLNSYFDIMIKVLQSNNAIVDKLIGDAIVTRFDSGDINKDALNAVTSAHEMLKKLKEFNKDSLEPIEIRIGINTGTLILGNIGCESCRLDYTMIGDNVNIGQRLESSAPHMGCLISESTYNLVKSHVSVGEPEEFSLKGKKSTVKAYPLFKVIS